MEPLTARKTWRTVEPIHACIYFAPERGPAYEAVGLTEADAYFVSRSAPMGAVNPDVVVATFFNFHPALVHGAMGGAWERTTPARALAARLTIADAALRRLVPDAIDAPDTAEAAELARTAALAACEHPEGRPLFAGHVALNWPDADAAHLVLWHAQTLLREFRGDGHIAALTAAGVSGCEALLLHAATGEVPASILKFTRAWPADEWETTRIGLVERGWLDDDGSLTPAGRAHRDLIEEQTDKLTVAAYEPLGDDGCERLRTLTRPISRAIVASGALGFAGQ